MVLLAVAFDLATLVPHTTVRVTLVDGRQATVELHVPKAYVWADPQLIRTLLASELSIVSPPAGLGPDGVSAAQIKTVEVVRGPAYWWWADSQVTGPAVALVLAPWLVFFVVRGVVRAARRPRAAR